MSLKRTRPVCGSHTGPSVHSAPEKTRSISASSAKKLIALLWQALAMTSFVSHTSVDCRNAYELSERWKRLLGYTDIADDPNEPGADRRMTRNPAPGHRNRLIEG